MGHGHPNGTRARGVGMDAPAFATGQLEDNQQGMAGPDVFLGPSTQPALVQLWLVQRYSLSFLIGMSGLC